MSVTAVCGMTDHDSLCREGEEDRQVSEGPAARTRAPPGFPDRLVPVKMKIVAAVTAMPTDWRNAVIVSGPIRDRLADDLRSSSGSRRVARLKSVVLRRGEA